MCPELVQKKDLLRFWGSLSTRQITNVGDLQNANRIAGDLQARGWDVTIRQARQMHARSFRTGNFVILGSSLSNPWADLFPVNETNFPFDELPRPGKPEIILNRHPLNGEPAKVRSPSGSQDRQEDHVCEGLPAGEHCPLGPRAAGGGPIHVGDGDVRRTAAAQRFHGADPAHVGTALRRPAARPGDGGPSFRAE